MAEPDDRWLAVNRSLDYALELQEAQREEWLAHLARESPHIASEVRELLGNRGYPDFAGFLTGDRARLSAGAADPSLAGQRVGPYILESELGSGGMGSVWLAHRSDGQYEGRAAIKFLHLAGAGREGQERFRREGQLLAKLNHPHIARLLDAGVLNSTQPYLVLEYVEGQRIDEYCDERRLDISGRVLLFLDVLSAVSHAHGHLIIHRDIKPANILVTRDGAVKLLDFGIARLLGEEAAAALTRAGGHVMTPEYAAPEQLRGEPVTTTTDVHALGIVLYQLLTGRHPFAEATRSPAEMMRRVLETDVPRPSTVVLGEADAPADTRAATAARRAATPGRLARLLRGDLDNIVAKATNKDPAGRYPTAEAFAQDLKRFLASEPVSARPDSLAYRAGKFVRRHRVAVAAAVLTALVLIAATVVATVQMFEARRQRDAALFQSKRAEFQGRFAYQIMAEVGGDGRPITIRELMEKGMEVLERNYADDPRFVIGMLINMSGRYMDLGDTNGEYGALVRAEGIARKLGDPDQIAHVQCNTVETELAAGRPEQAEERMQDALANLAKLRDVSDDRSIECGMARARLLWSQAKLDEAIDAARKAAEILETRGQTTDAFYITASSMLAVMLAEEGRLHEAIDWNQRLITAHEQAGRRGTLAWNTARHNEARYLYGTGDVRAAFDLELAAVNEIAAQQGVESIPGSLAAWIGFYYVRMEETDAGLEWLDRAVAAGAAQDNQAVQIGALINRARALLLLRRFDAAHADLETAEELARANPDDNRRALRAARLVQAQLLAAQDDSPAALDEVDGLLADVGYPSRRAVDMLASMLVLKARAELALGRCTEALSTAREALTAAESVALSPERSADVGAASMILSDAQRALGDIAGAQTSAARAAEALANSLGPEHSESRAALAFTQQPAASQASCR